MKTIEQYKTQARALRHAMNAAYPGSSPTVSHSAALDLVAQMEGLPNWNALAARAEKSEAEHIGLETLRKVLKRMRWDDQGGYPGRSNGKWDFVSTALPQTTPEELDELFRLAGIVPDEIQSKGTCDTCGHAKVYPNGSRGERGYEKPCFDCKRPRNSNWVPIRVEAPARKKALAWPIRVETPARKKTPA